jgi:hypothetical protein
VLPVQDPVLDHADIDENVHAVLASAAHDGAFAGVVHALMVWQAVCALICVKFVVRSSTFRVQDPTLAQDAVCAAY